MSLDSNQRWSGRATPYNYAAIFGSALQTKNASCISISLFDIPARGPTRQCI